MENSVPNNNEVMGSILSNSAISKTMSENDKIANNISYYLNLVSNKNTQNRRDLLIISIKDYKTLIELTNTKEEEEKLVYDYMPKIKSSIAGKVVYDNYFYKSIDSIKSKYQSTNTNNLETLNKEDKVKVYKYIPDNKKAA